MYKLILFCFLYKSLFKIKFTAFDILLAKALCEADKSLGAIIPDYSYIVAGASEDSLLPEVMADYKYETKERLNTWFSEESV